MAQPIRIPLITPDATGCCLSRWLVPLGAEVSAGEVVAEADVDEMIADCTAPVAGVLLRRVVGEGQTATQGAVIGAVGEAWEQVSELDLIEWSGVEGWPGEPPPSTDQPLPPPPASVIADPRVRNVARKLGVRLEDVIGTGEGGAITRQDVINARQALSDEAPGE